MIALRTDYNTEGNLIKPQLKNTTGSDGLHYNTEGNLIKPQQKCFWES